MAEAPSRSAQQCRYWSTTGSCTFGDRCNFSHAGPAGGASSSTAASGASTIAPSASAATATGTTVLGGSGTSGGVSHHATESMSSVLGTGGTGPAIKKAPPRARVTGPGVARARAHGRGPAVKEYVFAQRPLSEFFVSEGLREDLLRRSQLAMPSVLAPESTLPPAVHIYHSLELLGVHDQKADTPFLPVPANVYKATSSRDGFNYALWQVDPQAMRLNQATVDHAMSRSETWKKLHHPNIVSLREVFVSKQIGNEPALYFAYDFHPGAATLESVFISGKEYITEPTIWSYIVQILAAIRAVHAQGAACRSIHPSKIILTGTNRIRLSAVGFLDSLNYHPPDEALIDHQRQDIVQVVKTVLALACSTPTNNINLPSCIEYIGAHFSPDLKNFVMNLLNDMNYYRATPGEISKLIPAHALWNHVEQLENYNDALEVETIKEIENGRLARLMVKLGFINERPAQGVEGDWSETGDRYILKLFRDYVFHQVSEEGRPVLDYGHVVSCLNKLDAGVDEKIMLTSRDEQSVLIVSYRDIKRCVEGALNELMHKQQMGVPGAPRHGGHGAGMF